MMLGIVWLFFVANVVGFLLEVAEAAREKMPTQVFLVKKIVTIVVRIGFSVWGGFVLFF